MSIDYGRGAGIEGVIDVSKSALGTPTFGCKVFYWQDATENSTVDNTGEGSQNVADSLALIESGNIVLRFVVQKALWPAPASLINATGTLVEIFDRQGPDPSTFMKRTQTVRVDKFEIKTSEKDNTSWEGSISCERISAAVYANWPGTQPTTAAREAGNRYLYRDRLKVYDSGALVDHSNQPINVWGITNDTDQGEVNAIIAIIADYNTAPINGETQYTCSCRRLSSGVLRMDLLWRRRNSTQDAIYPSTYALRPPNDPWVDSVPSIITASGTPYSQATAIANASQGTPFLSSIIVKPMTPQLNMLTLKYTDPGIMFRGKGTGGGRYVNARLNGTDMQVYVLQNLAMGTSPQRRVQLSRQWVTTSSNLSFTIDRAVTGTVIPRQNPDTINGQTLPFYGQVNSSIFEGLTQNSCMYISSIFSVKKAASGSMTMFMRYSFQQDDYSYFISEVPEDLFVREQPLTTNFTANHTWVSAAILGLTLQRPTEASFSAFTS